MTDTTPQSDANPPQAGRHRAKAVAIIIAWIVVGTLYWYAAHTSDNGDAQPPRPSAPRVNTVAPTDSFGWGSTNPPPSVGTDVGLDRDIAAHLGSDGQPLPPPRPPKPNFDWPDDEAFAVPTSQPTGSSTVTAGKTSQGPTATSTPPRH